VILVYGLSNGISCNNLDCPWRSLLHCKPDVKFSTLVARMKCYPWNEKLSRDFLPSAVQADVVCLTADKIKHVFLILMSRTQDTIRTRGKLTDTSFFQNIVIMMLRNPKDQDASPIQISSKSVYALWRYSDFTILQYDYNWPFGPQNYGPRFTCWWSARPQVRILHVAGNVGLDWIEQGLTFHQTHYRLYRGRVFTGQMTQPTVSKHWRKIGPKD